MDASLIHLPDNSIVADVADDAGRSFGDALAILRAMARLPKDKSDRWRAWEDAERARMSNERVRREEERQAAKDAARARVGR